MSVLGADGKFTNPWPDWQQFTYGELVKWWWSKGKHAWYGWLMNNETASYEEVTAQFPVLPLDTAALGSPPGNAIQASWIGHATCLVQLDGCTFLTDPVFSSRAGPWNMLGPRRTVKCPLSVEAPNLPHIDFVVISHNHYDHLDVPSVQQLHSRFGKDLRWYVPLKLGSWFESLGITNVQELDWWQEAPHPGSSLAVTLTPAQHWSSRLGYDKRRSLWGGFCVRGKQQRIWFAGDTGYCPVFKEIGERLGPFNLAFIPIGNYIPANIARYLHCSPSEAVQIHQDVKAERSIAIHHGTFGWDSGPMDEPRHLLKKAATAAQLPQDTFTCVHHGAVLRFPG